MALQLAETAGKLLLVVRGCGLWQGKALGDAGDVLANALICRALAEWRPDDGLLSEEVADDAVRLSRSRVWVIDPLDGTREYAEQRSDWAVHVALVVDGVPTTGAVALPALGLVMSAAEPPPLAPLASGRPRILVSRTRPPVEAQRVAERIGADLIGMGSAGAKAMAVLRGEADAYLHSGGQYEWDSAAPVAVALAAGLHASRLDGSPLRYNQAKPYLPDLLISHPGIAQQILAAVPR
ncbi:MAG: 3'(2'),5'-bisphosphate nucleotidase CysQ [Azospirillaceae bacterium]|nr:3'(2'),5'-bisphosphate nucleotidase CysQ [Azospirillaceae bacterium]